MIKEVIGEYPYPYMCDICSSECNDAIVDGATRMGPWATMCNRCAMSVGLGFGTGRGQRYEWTEICDGELYAHGEWVKTAG